MGCSSSSAAGAHTADQAPGNPNLGAMATAPPEVQLSSAGAQTADQAPGNPIAGAKAPAPPEPVPVPELVDLCMSTEELKKKYGEVDSLRNAVASFDTALVKGSWLLSFSKSGGSLPRRQDLVASESLWEPIDLNPQIDRSHNMGCSPEPKVPIVGLSYCWATPAHPDPFGEQLVRISVALRAVLANRSPPHHWAGSPWAKDVAMFMDWCSLYQNPRTPEEQECFGRALRNVNLWYAHELTWVWLLTRVPEAVKPYAERGWPSFERAVACLIKDFSMVLDIGVDGYEACTYYGELQKICAQVNASGSDSRAVRPPPLAPDEFNKLLEAKSFTNGADHGFVQKKYYETFVEVMASATKINYAHLGWGDTEFAKFCHALMWCTNLAELFVFDNKISDISPFANVLESGGLSNLQFFRICDNHISDLSPLSKVLCAGAAPKLNHMDITKNEISDSDIETFKKALTAAGRPSEGMVDGRGSKRK